MLNSFYEIKKKIAKLQKQVSAQKQSSKVTQAKAQTLKDVLNEIETIEKREDEAYLVWAKEQGYTIDES